jgi:N-methylhydantoinase A
MTWSAVRDLYAELERAGRDILAAARVSAGDVRLIRQADMRYTGQGYEITVNVPAGPIDDTMAPRLRSAFEASYTQLYGRALQGVPVEILNWRATAGGPTPPLRPLIARRSNVNGCASALKGTRCAYFVEAGGFVETSVYDRYALQPGDRLEGPAIIEERESTTVVGPATTVTVDDTLNLVLTLPA